MYRINRLEHDCQFHTLYKIISIGPRSKSFDDDDDCYNQANILLLYYIVIGISGVFTEEE